jgi:hypothetical protein
MSGQRPWVVDCADGSTASDVAVVVVSLFDHVDGVERTVGDPCVAGASALVAPRSRFRDLSRGQGKLSSRERCEDFSRRKLCTLVPTTAIPAGVVSFFGASLWLTSRCYISR